MNNKDSFRLFILLPILLTSIIGYSQENIVELTGIVVSPNYTVSDILVVNINSKKSTITDIKGFFSIEVKLQDTLQFSAVSYRKKEIVITDEILNQKKIQVDLEEKIVNLDEVVILPHNLTGTVAHDIKKFDTNPVITSTSLGLPKANIKVKTKNERLLFEADDGKLIKFYGVAATVNVTKLLNKISGRTKKLKNRVLLDKHIKIENEIDNLFSKQVLSEALGIPQTNIADFLDFCVNHPDFSKLPETIDALKVLKYFKSKSYEYKKENGLN
ncbi:carboxypeptidase-like regulatory domain-containing protein [Aquimarina aggregata]|uniref:carboxypeptidase-like regulatory domain-containing protein n=1 Tax=Aquimarina aggregata TaxID=1642818 RepID=UPI002491D4E2|nr:carboxypeptidase-like regulatory domain-containing protein [Aquimarina aggregata]